MLEDVLHHARTRCAAAGRLDGDAMPPCVHAAPRPSATTRVFVPTERLREGLGALRAARVFERLTVQRIYSRQAP
jgi:hypothetical protein